MLTLGAAGVLACDAREAARPAADRAPAAVGAATAFGMLLATQAPWSAALGAPSVWYNLPNLLETALPVPCSGPG